jgi:predicted GNAT family acetyltransferase
MSDIEIVDAPDQSRYEARSADGALMGFAEYRRSPGRIAFVHTVTLPEFRGHGVAGTLASTTLDQAREEGLRVRTICPFYARYASEHPDYADLVDHHE